MPIKITHEKEDAFAELACFYNYHCARISSLLVKDANTAREKEKVYKVISEIYDTMKSVDNRIEMQQEVDILLKSLKI